MMRVPIHLALLLWCFCAAADGATFELFELPIQTYPDAICNDGTRAGFYHDTDLSKYVRIILCKINFKINNV